MALLIACVLSLLCTISSSKTVHSVPKATVRNGTYLGYHQSSFNQDYFLGVPYAQPPVGDLRFRVPHALNTTWKGTRSAQEYSAGCFGYYGNDKLWNKSEDCLYLNIVRPSGFEHKKLPVAFWIHGGGFVAGSSIDPRYNLSFIVENSGKIGKPIVAVSINYRLSAWGFLASKEIAGAGATNLGLRDQRLAMQWVQENIAAFGGDPRKVTIWGESAGSQAVGFHLTAYGGRDDQLFRGAIMESGNPVYWISLYNPDYYQFMYDDIVGLTGCNTTLDTLQCLRDLPVETLGSVINSTEIGPANWTVFAPVLDGDFLQRYTSYQLEEGQFVHIPIISGTVSDEGSEFCPLGINTTQQLFDAMTSFQNFPAVPASFADELLKVYPDDPSVNAIAIIGDATPPAYPWGEQFRRVASYYGDGLIIAGRRLTCQTWAAADVPAYCFRFNTRIAGVEQYWGVEHGTDVPFFFLNLEGVGYEPLATPPFQDQPKSTTDLAYFIGGSWISFVHDLDPNAWRRVWKGKEVVWPEYGVAAELIVFDANETSFAEPDTWREEAIRLINDHNADVYNR